MPRQLSFTDTSAAEPPKLVSTLIVVREQIPQGLSEEEKRLLRERLQHTVDGGRAYFFADCPVLRRMFRIPLDREQ